MVQEYININTLSVSSFRTPSDCEAYISLLDVLDRMKVHIKCYRQYKLHLSARRVLVNIKVHVGADS